MLITISSLKTGQYLDVNERFVKVSGFSAAEAIRVHAEQRGDDLTVRHIDVMDFVPKGFRTLYTDYYLKLVSTAPALR